MEEPPRPPSVDESPDAVDAAATTNEYLRNLAIKELGEVRVALQETGSALETSRAERQSVTAEFASGQAEWVARESALRADLTTTEEALASTRDLLSQSRADAERAARDSSATIQSLQEHIGRLKMQIQSPWRLIAKWFLRRGPFASASRDRSH